MALPTPPIGPGNPIPNNPFYYPTTNRLEGGDQGLVIIGAGLTITPEGVLNATGTGGTAVTTLTAGPGMFVSQPDGNVLVANTGVISITPGPGISISGSSGNYTITNTSPASGPTGTVSSVATGVGLVGGPITTSGTIALDTVSTVAPGTYTNATITVDAYGRVTYAAPGTSGGGAILATAPLAVTSTFPQTLSVSSASTASAGVVQLNTSTSSTSTTQAATPSAVKAAYDLGSTAAVNAATALSTATGAASAASTAQTAANSAQSTATAAQTAAVTAQSTANTALANAAAAQTTANAAIPCASFTAKGQLLAATGPATFSALTPGANGQVLVACSACTSGLTWISQSSAAGTVTTVATGAGLTGGPITTSGTISLLPTAVTPGSYTAANITVDAYGRITAASSGVAGGVTQIVAGTNVTISPVGGTGVVTINASGGSTVADATPTVPGIVAAYTDTTDTDFSTALGYCALNSQAGGVANTAIGVCAGVAITTGYLNTLLGAAAGYATDTGVGNILLGGASGCALTSGNFNIALGACAGCSYTTETGNVIIGAAAGVVAECETITLSTGTGAIRQKFDCGGALSFDGSSFGSSGQVLTSQGANTQPTWTTVASSGGTVTSIVAGTGLSGGTITTTGTIALANTAVTAGSYTNGSFTVDAQGRLTAASSGTAPVTAVTGTAPIAVTAGTTPAVSIASASTTALGATQLTNALNSTSQTLALTACAGKCLQDQITTLLTTPGIDFAGTIDASTGFVLSVTSVGTAAGYTVGSVLPAASATTVNTYVIVTTPGTFTPPGGASTTAGDGDWFLASETSPGVYSWQFLNVGFDAPPATTSVAGVVCLSTNALAQAGTDTTTALTPSAAASAFIPKACVTAKGALITGTAANTPVALTVGTDGQALIACAACSSGLTWGTVTSSSATPTVAGIVLGCTTASNTAIGCNALVANTSGTNNVAIGLNSGCSNTTGCGSVYIGQNAGCLSSGNYNTIVGAIALSSGTALTSCDIVAVGAGALRGATGAGAANTIAIGTNAGCSITTGTFNTLVGDRAGCNITTGSCNVAIGPFASVASATGSCQLAIGFSATCNWLTGDSTKAIKPGAGIIDCANSCGTAGQVLTSNGANAVCWSSIAVYPTWTSAGTIQSVGWGATGTPPVVGGTTRNNVSYRQIGPKEWTVVYTFTASTGFTNIGAGDYLFTLPNSLQFNTSLPWQPAFTGSVSTSNHANRQYFIPGASSMQVTWTNGGNGSQFGAGVVVYNSTLFRIFTTDVGNGGPRAIGANYWGDAGTALAFSVGFQFSTP